MEGYTKKTPLAGFADGVLARLTLLGVGVIYFIWLWGLSLPAVYAGLALGIMMVMCIGLYRRMTLKRREKHMRRAIGGELALERLLLMQPRRAAFQAAMWLSPKYELEMVKTARSGVLCRSRGKSVLVRLAAKHKSMPVTADDAVTACREAAELNASALMLCATSPVSREARAYLERADVKERIIERSELQSLAGLASPATDEQLSGLSARGGGRLSVGRILSQILDRRRAKRYFVYGLGMAAMYLITGMGYYPIPAVICLTLCILCLVLKPIKGQVWP